MTERAALVAAARETIARGSLSFSLASRLFDRATRERAWLLYAWCRHCDDVMDGQALGGGMSQVDDPVQALAAIRVGTSRALAGEPAEPPFEGLAIVAAECAIPMRYVEDHLDGFALDAKGWQPRSEADLIRYCYHVAGSVGCMMAIIMGVPQDDEDTLSRASDLGLAFQLANIARDLGEDDLAGRNYLPHEWLAELDVPPGEALKPHFRKRLAVAARWLGELAADREASARVGAARLPFRARWAVLAAAGIYGEIVRDVVRRGDKAWDERVTISGREKLSFVGQALREARRGTPA
ncbi:MAG TPA: phytoene/squalene synthase family protein [Sphingomonadaceae bacterium]|nr:phytoene/squalene synthase family protein [Sphingomonadaceae bacterium]